MSLEEINNLYEIANNNLLELSDHWNLRERYRLHVNNTNTSLQYLLKKGSEAIENEIYQEELAAVGGDPKKLAKTKTSNSKAKKTT